MGARGSVSWGKEPGHEAIYSIQTDTVVKNVRIYTPTPTYVLIS
jgi:hypothetical protein